MPLKVETLAKPNVSNLGIEIQKLLVKSLSIEYRSNVILKNCYEINNDKLLLIRTINNDFWQAHPIKYKKLVVQIKNLIMTSNDKNKEIKLLNIAKRKENYKIALKIKLREIKGAEKLAKLKVDEINSFIKLNNKNTEQHDKLNRWVMGTFNTKVVSKTMLRGALIRREQAVFLLSL